MRLKFLCDTCGISYDASMEDREISSIAMDSRRVTEGGLFVCICGLHTDGHDYIDTAIEAGAVCILTEREVDHQQNGSIIYLSCASTREAAARLFDAWYGFPTRRLKLIGVTGTNGKTSVTHMLRAILESSLCRCGLIGTVGCESAGRYLENRAQDALANMTTPDPPELYRMLAEMVEDGVEYVLMEVTSHALALGKLAPMEFEAAIFTNLTPEHLDFHGDMKHYAEAKAMLFEKSRLSVINIDDRYATQMIKASRGRIVTCSIRRDADYFAEPLENGAEVGVAYKLISANGAVRIRCPIPGKFSMMNSMQAAVLALELGFPARAVQDALASLSGIKGRMERVRLGVGADFTVLIDYAHTPDALENLLRTARELTPRGGRVTVLFGCGGDRDRGKRPLMGRIASENADCVILTSDNSRSENPGDIISQIRSGILPEKTVTVIENRREAIEYAVRNAKKDDVLLLAGKGHEEYEIDGSEKRPFCEKQIVTEAFQRRRRNQN